MTDAGQRARASDSGQGNARPSQGPPDVTDDGIAVRNTTATALLEAGSGASGGAEAGGAASPAGRAVRPGPGRPPSPPVLMSMQRMAGNRAVAALLARQSAGSAPTGPQRSPARTAASFPAALPVQRCGDHACEGGCAPPVEEDETVQRALESTATRIVEPDGSLSGSPEGGAPGGPANGGAEEPAGAPPAGGDEAATPEGAGEGSGEDVAAEAAAPAGGAAAGAGGEAPSPGAGGQGGGGERAAPGDGGGVNATCYRADVEEPAEEPDEEPPEPEPAEAQEQVESETPEAEETDECPVEEAIEAAAPDGAGAGLAAAGSGAGPAGGAAPDGAAGGAGGGALPAEAAAPDGEVAAEANAEMAAARAPLDTTIGEVESAHGEAGAAYDSAAAALAETEAQLQDVPADVAFQQDAGADGGSRRAAAQGRATSFLARGAARVGEVLAVGQETIPDRVGAVSASMTAALGLAIETQKSAISARVEQARGEAHARAEAARQRVDADYAASIATIEAETSAALDALVSAHADTLQTVDDRETDTLDEIDERYADSREAHEALGPTLAEEAIARGQEYKAAYEDCKIHRKDSFWAGYLTDRRAEAQQNAARETAKGYADSLQEAAAEQAGEVTKGRGKDRCAVIAAAARARDTADGQLEALTSAIERAAADVVAQADATRARMRAAVEGALASTMSALDQQERQQRQAANDAGYLQQLLIEQIAHAGAASVQAAAGQGAATALDALLGARALFASSPAPDPALLDERLGRAAAALEGGVGRVLEKIEGGAATVEGRLGQAFARGIAALEGVTAGNEEQTASQTTGFTATFTRLMAGAADAFAQQTEAYATQAQTAAANGARGLAEVASGFEESCAITTTEVGAALDDSLERLEVGLRESLASIDSTSTGIPKQAREAAAHEQPAWKSVVKWVLIIAIVVVVALVVGPAVIGAVGAAAASLGAGAAATAIGTVVGGAIVGAATSATITVVSNVAEGRTWHQGVGRASVMGAIGGAFGAGAGALIGKYVATTAFQVAANVAADAVLEVGIALVTSEFSWEALGMAVLMSAVTGGFGEVRAVKGMQQRFMHRGASAVPGARGRAYADSLRPPDAGPRADEEAGAPTGPRADEEAGAPAAPHATPEAEVPARVGESDHHLGLRGGPGRAEVWVCSGVCGPLKARIDDILPHVAPDSPAHAKLTRLRAEAGDVEARINRGEVPDAARQQAEVDGLGRRLTEIGQDEPHVGALLDAPPAPSGGAAPARLQAARMREIYTGYLDDAIDVGYHVARARRLRQRLAEASANPPQLRELESALARFARAYERSPLRTRDLRSRRGGPRREGEAHVDLDTLSVTGRVEVEEAVTRHLDQMLADDLPGAELVAALSREVLSRGVVRTQAPADRGTDRLRAALLRQHLEGTLDPRVRAMFDDRARWAGERMVTVDGRRHPWPEDGSGAPWEVHHVHELGFGGGDVEGNYLPLPKETHDAISAMWREIQGIAEIRGAYAEAATTGGQVEPAEF